jgi:hypothetical protein
MILLSSENRERTKHVEKTQSQVVGLLKRKEVAKDLGSCASDLLAIAEELYVPNIKDGVISLPKKYRYSDFTPAIGILPGETLFVDSSLASFAPQQARNARTQLDALLGEDSRDLIERFDDAMIDAVVRNDARQVYLPEERGVGGFGSFSFGEVLSPDFKLRFTGRLVLFLGMRDYSELDNATLQAHEITHVNQHTQNPLLPFEKTPLIRRRLRDELEACRTGRIIGDHSPKVDLKNPAFDDQLHIDNIRQGNMLGASPYDVNDLAKVALISLTGAKNGFVSEVYPEE